MTTMQVESLWLNPNTRQRERLGSLYRTAKHGWASPEAFVKYHVRAYKHRDPKPYGNGLEMRGDVGTIQRITFAFGNSH